MSEIRDIKDVRGVSDITNIEVLRDIRDHTVANASRLTDGTPVNFGASVDL